MTKIKTLFILSLSLLLLACYSERIPKEKTTEIYDVVNSFKDSCETDRYYNAKWRIYSAMRKRMARCIKHPTEVFPITYCCFFCRDIDTVNSDLFGEVVTLRFFPYKICDSTERWESMIPISQADFDSAWWHTSASFIKDDRKVATLQKLDWERQLVYFDINYEHYVNNKSLYPIFSDAEIQEIIRVSNFKESENIDFVNFLEQVDYDSMCPWLRDEFVKKKKSMMR